MAGNTANTEPNVKTFACKNCGGTVEVRAPGQTLVASCQFCQTVIDITDENFKIIKRYKEATKRKPGIPLGSRGKLKGIDWEVIGYMIRLSRRYAFRWEEFLLFNPIHGFRWLAVSDGHWTLYSETKDKPAKSLRFDTQIIDQIEYNSFDRYDAEVEYVIGEFYYRVKKGDSVRVQDLINPPLLLSIEEGKNSFNWSIGEYLQPREIKKAFGDQAASLPGRTGIAPNQPNHYRKYFRELKGAWGILVAALVAIWLYLGFSSSSSEIFKQSFTLSTAEQVFPRQIVEIPNSRSQNLEVRAYSPVTNSWVEINASLYDSTAAKAINFQIPISYYEGVADGEKWTEGSRRWSKTINEIPPGKYDLVMEAFTEGAPKNVSLTINRGVGFGSNFFLTLLAISFIPLLLLGLSSSFEYGRWNQE